MNLYDAHNHLHDEWLLPHLDRVAADLGRAGLAGAVVNGTTPDDWSTVSALASRFPWVVPSYGVHPWDCGNRPSDWLGRLESRLATEPRARVGEIGLDRWILDRARPDDARLAGLRRAPLAEQLEVFLLQLDLAATHNLAASIHCLDAHGALLEALRRAILPACGFLLHAYSGPAEMVRDFADLGAHFSFNGSFLEPRKTRLRDLYAALPADRLLVETDAPAMRLPPAHEKFAPLSAPAGAQANHPANLAATYAALADLRRQPLSALADTVAENFRRLFATG